MDVTYAIVNVYVTERNDVIKRYSNVITIWRTSAIEVTALLNNLRSETIPDTDPRDGYALSICCSFYFKILQNNILFVENIVFVP